MASSYWETTVSSPVVAGFELLVTPQPSTVPGHSEIISQGTDSAHSCTRRITLRDAKFTKPMKAQGTKKEDQRKGIPGRRSGQVAISHHPSDWHTSALPSFGEGR